MTGWQKRTLLREWRGVDDAEAAEGGARALDELVREEFSRLRLLERFDEASVAAVWRSVVGDFIADNTRPVGLVGGCLTVAVLQPALRFELERVCKGGILRKLKTATKSKVRDIVFKLS